MGPSPQHCTFVLVALTLSPTSLPPEPTKAASFAGRHDKGLTSMIEARRGATRPDAFAVFGVPRLRQGRSTGHLYSTISFASEVRVLPGARAPALTDDILDRRRDCRTGVGLGGQHRHGKGEGGDDEG